MSADRERIAEVAEADATGETAALYADIRALLGVPMVNLVYRHMAAFTGVLPWAWGAVRPAVADGTIPAAARALADEVALSPAAVIPRAALPVLGVDARAHQHVVTVLAAYNRANPCNLVITSTLLRLAAEAEGDAAAGGAMPPPPPAVSSADPADVDLGPPMVEPAAMGPEVAALVGTLPGAAGIVPSLYRHLANWPQLLAVQAALLEPHRPALPHLTARLEERAAIVAERLLADGAIARLRTPVAWTAAGEDLRVTAFPGVVASMVVVGKAFAACLPGRLGLDGPT